YLILAYGSFAGKYGLVINSGGNFLVYGATVTPSALATADALAGVTTISVANANTLGWNVGDTVAVGTEAVKVTSIGANSIDFTPALVYAHYSTTPVIVAELTRNVVIRSSGTDFNTNSAYL